MSCIFFHKWGRWFEYKNEWKRVHIKTGTILDQYELRQKRVCEICGKVQDEFVRGM